MTNLHSPLAHIGTVANCENAGVIMREDRYRGHLNLRGDANNPVFAAAVEQVLGVALPTQPQTTHELVMTDKKVQTRIGWLGPNEWLLLVSADTQGQVEADLRVALAGQHAAITDLSSGQTLVNLSGANLTDVMMKSTVYNCDEHNLPVGKIVQTTFAKAGAVIYRCVDGSFDLVIRRSFADYFFLWLADASAEYGLQLD